MSGGTCPFHRVRGARENRPVALGGHRAFALPRWRGSAWGLSGVMVADVILEILMKLAEDRSGGDKKREGDRRSGWGPGGSALLICPPEGAEETGRRAADLAGDFKELLTAKAGFPRDCWQSVSWLCLLCRICGGWARAIRPRRRGWGCGPGWLILAGRRVRAGGDGGSGKSGGLSQDGGRVFPHPFSAPSQTWGGGKEGGAFGIPDGKSSGTRSWAFRISSFFSRLCFWESVVWC